MNDMESVYDANALLDAFRQAKEGYCMERVGTEI